MKRNEFYSFIKSHNLVNRIYDMVYFFGIIKNPKNEEVIKKYFNQKLEDVEYVETLASYFEMKLKKNKGKADLRCNLTDLIYDLEYLKQYLCK